jgi:hypothetical protein
MYTLYVKDGHKIHPALALGPTASSSCLFLCQSYTPNEEQNFPYRDIMVITRFHEVMAHVTESMMKVSKVLLCIGGCIYRSIYY